MRINEMFIFISLSETSVRLMGSSHQSFCLCSSDEHMTFSCDVSKPQEVQETFDSIHKSCGGISYLVNAAGINRSDQRTRPPPVLTW